MMTILQRSYCIELYLSMIFFMCLQLHTICDRTGCLIVYLFHIQEWKDEYVKELQEYLTNDLLTWLKC